MTALATRMPFNQIRDGQRLDLAATDEECAAISERLGLERLDRFTAHVVLSRKGETVRATGRIRASVEQRCVASGEPVAALVDEPFDFLFVPEPKGGPDEEIELSAEDCDRVFHDGQTIDLGEALADTLSLSLDPYPRAPGAEAALREAGVLSEEQAGPFAALAALRRGDDHG